MKYIAFLMCLILILSGCKNIEDPIYDDEVIEAEYVNRAKQSRVITNMFARKIIELPDGLSYTDYLYHDDVLYFICGDTLVQYEDDVMETIHLPQNVIDLSITYDGDYLIYDGTDIIKMTRNNEVTKTIKVDSSGDFIDIFTDKLDRIYYFTTESLYVLSAEGNNIFNININGTLNDVHQFTDGKIILNIDNKFIYLDVNERRLDNENEIKLPVVPYEYEPIFGDGFEIYMKAADLSIYGYLEREIVPIKILDMINSGVNIYDIADLKIISPNFMFYVTRDNKITLLNKIAPDETVTLKTQVTLASYGYDEQLIDLVLDFNALNKATHVNIHDYSIYGFSDEIDLFIGDENLDIDEFITQGLCTDLNRLMEHDEQLSQRHILDYVRSPFTYDGQLYKLTSNFKIHLFAGKNSIVGEDFHWTTPKFEDIIPELGGKINLTSNIQPLDMLSLLITSNLYGLVFSDLGFQDDTFYELLEVCRNIHVGNIRNGTYKGDNTEFREDKTLLYYFEFKQPDDYTALPEIFGTDEITIKNLCVTVEPIRSYAISRKSDEFAIGGAWEFVKTLMNEYQVDGYFSSLVSDFDERIDSSALSDTEKIYISDLIKNGTPVKVSANNSAIFEIVKTYAGLYLENAISEKKTGENIDLRAKRYLANTVFY